MHDIETGIGRLPGNDVDELVFAAPVVERRNQRLNQAGRSVDGACIAPLLQIMRGIDMPMAELARFILIEAVPHPQWNLVHRVGEVQVLRRVVNRIGADDHQQIDIAAVHVIDQFFQSGHLIHWLGFDGIGVDDCVADRSQRLIHGMSQRMNRRRLVLAGNDHGRAMMRFQVCDDVVDELLLRARRSLASAHRHADSGGNGARNLFHLRCTHR